MHDAPSFKATFDYAMIRVVPSVERGEFLNVGVIVFCSERHFLEAKIELDCARVKAFAPNIDQETIEEYLQTIPRVCAGGKAAGTIGQMTQRERFHWLVAPRSTIIQTSPGHCGLCDDPAVVLERLLEKLVRVGECGN